MSRVVVSSSWSSLIARGWLPWDLSCRTSRHKKMKYFTTKGDTVSRARSKFTCLAGKWSMAGWDIIEFWAGYLNVLFDKWNPMATKIWPLLLIVLGTLIKREIYSQVYGKQQTSDSCWEFLKIENRQIETAQNNSCRQKWHETTNFCVEVMNSKWLTIEAKTWSRGTNSRLLCPVNVTFNLPNKVLIKLS